MSNFMFYENFLTALELLPEGEREKACYEFCKYGVTGELPDDKSIAMFCIGVSVSVRKFDGRGGAREGAGAPKGNQNANKKQSDNQNQSEVEINQNNQKQSNQSNDSKQSKPEKQSEMINININKNINLKHIQENIILSPYNGFEKCSCECQRKAKFEINGVKYCGQHTRMELTKLGRLDLMPVERFTKPTIEEIQTYCRERNNTVEASKFFDFYESKGWKVGNSPMKDWRAAVRTWEKSSVSASASRKTAESQFQRNVENCKEFMRRNLERQQQSENLL